MAHFRDAFWSTDYAGGLGVLFGKLQQGVQENQQVLTIARMRADAEELYGQHISDIGPATDRIQDGFQRDDGASVRKAYEGVRTEMEEAAQKHYKISQNIRELVVYPFGRWCEQHATRVQHSQDDLQARVKAHDKQADAVRKMRTHYFNKCRLVEDLEEEDKLAFKEPQSESVTSPTRPTVTIVEPVEDDLDDVELGDAVYQTEPLKKLLMHMLDNIALTETKVPILGTYQNVSRGSDIVQYIQQNMGANNMGYAERIGQDMIAHGFLRLVGNVGSVFANSSRMFYQWRTKVFRITGYPERKKPLDRSNTTMSLDSLDSPMVGAVGEYLSNWNPLNNPHPNETPSQKLRREAKEADERYKAGVRKLDLLRCSLEETMMEHMRFMERCELDRLKAIKSVILDFSGALSNVIPSLQSTVDKMMLFQETVQPAGDLRYLMESYRIGNYAPKVTTYENYYNSVDDQTFGVDLEARAKADRKRVPLIVTSILMYLDSHYPLLAGDEARQAIWLVEVSLAETHRLRHEVNNGKIPPAEVFDKYEVPVVASLLKLYLLELPDSLVSSNLYEIIKTVYSTPATAGTDSGTSSTRISVLQNTLGQLRLANIATLDAITTHFCRLVDLTSADEEYVTSLCQLLAPCILRQRNESSLSFEEKYNYRFLRDLLEFKDAIFNELKRASSVSHSAKATASANTAGEITDGRPRGQSNQDESNRRAHMEERNRAIASRSRASSPVPSRDRDRDSVPPPPPTLLEQQRHRRDSSKGPPAETRFPVNVSGTPARAAATVIPTPATPGTPASTATSATVARHSLEVPGSTEASPVVAAAGPPPAPSAGAARIDTSVNGHGADHGEAVASASPTAPSAFADVGDGERRTSLERSRVRKAGSGGTGLGRPVGLAKRDGGEAGGAAVEERRPVGVELTDKPMDD